MTIKELYDKAVILGKENYDIQLQYQDGGGSYCGSCPLEEIDYDDRCEEVTLA